MASTLLDFSLKNLKYNPFFLAVLYSIITTFENPLKDWMKQNPGINPVLVLIAFFYNQGHNQIFHKEGRQMIIEFLNNLSMCVFVLIAWEVYEASFL